MLFNIINKMQVWYKQTRLYRFYNLATRSHKYLPMKAYVNIRKNILFWKVCKHTQQAYPGLSNVYDLAETVERNGMAGCFVECGVWRGGCAAVMASVTNRARSNRKTWLFDSFEGMPEATEIDTGEIAGELANNRMGGELVPIGTNIASTIEVKDLLFNRLHLDERQIILVEGWFQDTLPKSKRRVGSIAILRIDADWYESTKTCLVHLYDDVVVGGFIIIDDYNMFPGCKASVEEFIAQRKLTVNLVKVDHSRIYFQKQCE
jgi:O-methyltransferase